MSQNPVLPHGSGVSTLRVDQLAPPQSFECSLDSTLGKSGPFRDSAQTKRHRSPVLLLRGPIKMEVNQKSCRLLIMPDQVAHQDVEDIVIHRDGSVKARHAGQNNCYTD